jgi:hypothetical protein
MIAIDESTTILTEHLVLRSLRSEDADEMADVLRDDILHEFTGGRPLEPSTSYGNAITGWSSGALQMASRPGSTGSSAFALPTLPSGLCKRRSQGERPRSHGS